MNWFKKLKLWQKVLIVILAIGIIGAAVGGGSSNDENKEDTPKTEEKQKKEEKKEDFTIEGEVTGDYDSAKMGYYIEGVIKNNTDKDKTYVQVTYNLYDKDGNQLGTALANVNNLKAGGTWKFKAMGMADGITKYELAEITGY